MNTHDLCTEEQASALAGVSARTLQRFAESGYLSVVLGEDGQGRYQRRQLEDIFGVTRHSESYDSTSENIETPGAAGCSFGVEPDYRATPTTSDADAVNLTEVSEVLGQPSASSSSSPRLEGTHAATIEIERLKNLLAIQERMLDEKDDQIADLKNQRTWLRERVEKLEEKSDRDQILLLSETQTIRSLIAYQESRKSTVRQVLEWLGFSNRDTSRPALNKPIDSSSHAQTGRTIEVQRAANSD